MRSPYRFMELSVVHFMAYPDTMRGEGPILETLEELAKMPFFTAVEVGPVKDREVRRKAAALMSQANLKVGFGAQPLVLLNGLNPNSPDAAKRAEAVEMLKSGLEQAAELGARRAALMSGPMPADPRDKGDQLKWLVDSLNALSDAAASLGLEGITLETFDFDIDKKALVGSNADGAFVSAEVRKSHPRFGLMIDLSHIPLQHEAIHAACRVVRGHLVHAHIGNCVLELGSPAYGDQHPAFGVPGSANGVDEVTAFLQNLFDTGFLGGADRPFVGFEVKPRPGETAAVILANTERVFQAAWARLNL